MALVETVVAIIGALKPVLPGIVDHDFQYELIFPSFVLEACSKDQHSMTQHCFLFLFSSRPMLMSTYAYKAALHD